MLLSACALISRLRAPWTFFSEHAECYQQSWPGTHALSLLTLSCCPAEINVRGMHAWKSLGALAEFPGTLVVEDSRPANEAYPSDVITPESLLLLEPDLSHQAAAKGARLYRQEGALVASDFDKLDPC